MTSGDVPPVVDCPLEAALPLHHIGALLVFFRRLGRGVKLSLSGESGLPRSFRRGTFNTQHDLPPFPTRGKKRPNLTIGQHASK